MHPTALGGVVLKGVVLEQGWYVRYITCMIQFQHPVSYSHPPARQPSGTLGDGVHLANRHSPDPAFWKSPPERATAPVPIPTDTRGCARRHAPFEKNAVW